MVGAVCVRGGRKNVGAQEGVEVRDKGEWVIWVKGWERVDVQREFTGVDLVVVRSWGTFRSWRAFG